MVILLSAFLAKAYGNDSFELWRGGVVVQTEDGGHLILGKVYRHSPYWDWDIVITKVDSLGQPIWAEMVGDTQDDEFFFAVKMPVGLYRLGGYSDYGAAWNAGFVLDIDAETGEVRGSMRLTSSESEVLYAATLTSDGKVVLVGSRHF